jgi:putative DNA methylase
MVRADLKQLHGANVKPTHGDIRCIAYGHLVRLAMWKLRNEWNRDLSTVPKLALMRRALDELGGWPLVEKALDSEMKIAQAYQSWAVSESATEYEAMDDAVSF